MKATNVTLTSVERLVLNQEIRENGCDVCQRQKYNGLLGDLHCERFLKFPKCRRQKHGFLLRED